LFAVLKRFILIVSVLNPKSEKTPNILDEVHIILRERLRTNGQGQKVFDRAEINFESILDISTHLSSISNVSFCYLIDVNRKVLALLPNPDLKPALPISPPPSTHLSLFSSFR